MKNPGGPPPSTHNRKAARITPEGNTLEFDSQKGGPEVRRTGDASGGREDSGIEAPAGVQRCRRHTPPWRVSGVRAIRYRADFSYERATAPDCQGMVHWLPVVEDVKSEATKTRVYGHQAEADARAAGHRRAGRYRREMDGLNFCGSLHIVCGHASERGFCTLNRCPVVLDEFQAIRDHYGPTGPKGRPGACPKCNSTEIYWDSKYDVFLCRKCGCSNLGGNMKKATCRGCGAPIVWIRTAAGKSMPCDAEPVLYKAPGRCDG